MNLPYISFSSLDTQQVYKYLNLNWDPQSQLRPQYKVLEVAAIAIAAASAAIFYLKIKVGSVITTAIAITNTISNNEFDNTFLLLH